MSGNEDQNQKTIDPTPNRIRQFRDKGDIARSKEFTGAATMFVGGLMLALYAPRSVAAITKLFAAVLGSLDQDGRGLLVGASADALWISCMPPMLGSLVAVLAVTAYQLGAPPALKKPGFDISKPFKFGGLAELVKPTAAAWRAIKSVLKVVFVGVAGWAAVEVEGELFETDPAVFASLLLERGYAAGMRILLYAGGALLLLSVADFVVAKRRMAKKMKMTPDEFKRDMRQQEGDPEIKRARRRRMQELASRRIATEVPNADVVIVNPTHYAVALKYVSGEDGAPRVVAKGVDTMAARIRELARKNSVPIVAKPPLARLLYRSVKEGKQVPTQLFGAVAEVLSYVYRLRRGTR